MRQAKQNEIAIEMPGVQSIALPSVDDVGLDVAQNAERLCEQSSGHHRSLDGALSRVWWPHIGLLVAGTLSVEMWTGRVPHLDIVAFVSDGALLVLRRVPVP